ncbi:DNA-processing protein DprA [Mycoplasma marinum]|uniref:DNA-processing protein DprA n=2 Tax=Mycoplasma marinum TaxID=1937190 RepID=A0A4R0XPS9_9MOLU|nr:DNA-processing protein DprA [Mycoplasma marinum]
MNMILIWFAIKYKGDWNKIYKALEDKEKVSLNDLRKMEESLKERSIEAITILDLEYPNQLKRAYKPPFVIFYQGNKKIFKDTFICTSGNKLNDKIKNWIKKSNKEVSKHFSFVSSLYKGVDEVVIKHALDNKANILLVSSSGLNKPFFAHKVEGQENILLISEYPNDVHVTKERLIARNRIVAAFGEKLVLYSSQKDGGIMNLVSNFLNQGKEIYCFPSEGDEDDGNSELIKQGANLILRIEELKK